jgi:hypothetical protein
LFFLIIAARSYDPHTETGNYCPRPVLGRVSRNGNNGTKHLSFAS